MSNWDETLESAKQAVGATVDVNAATAVYRSAQARYFDAQTQGQLIDNVTAQALADSAVIAYKREAVKDVWDEAGNARHRTYHFTDDVDIESVERVIDTFTRWSRIDIDDPRPWKFVICSNGGNVIAGIKLHALLKAVAQRRELITVASGICASMACVIHQAGTKRVIEPGCSYMLHDVAGGTSGSLSSMQDTMVWLNMINHQLHLLLAEKAKISVDAIETICHRHDAWYMPDDVVEMGLADEIGYAL